MTNLEIEHITTLLMIKWAIIFYIMTIPFKFWTQNRALKKIKSLLQEGEVIIYKPNFDYSVEIILPLIVGGFFGGFILPFYLYPEIQNIMLLNRNNLLIGIIAEIICLLIFLIFSCKINVLTNHRLFNQWTFNFLNILGNDPNSSSALFKNTNLNYSDIFSIKNRKSFWVNIIDIKTKNNQYLYLRGVKNLNKIKSIIDEQIKENDK